MSASLPAANAPLRRLPAVGTCLELLKPITWFAPMWAFACGAVASGRPMAGHILPIAAGILLAGPLVCGTSQAANDWFDRYVDAINEPGRPIPSGRMPGRTGLYLAVGWTLLSAAVACLLGPFAAGAALIGLALAWAYSAPPLRLKMNGWWGNAACGACYEGLPWLTAAAILHNGAPLWHSWVLAGAYSFGAHGIMTLNDFKSVQGDAGMGIRSLPVQLGVDRAATVACQMMAIPQIGVILLLVVCHHPWSAAAIAALLLAQIALMFRFVQDPRRLAPWYNGTGTSLFVLGMMVSAFAMRTAS